MTRYIFGGEVEQAVVTEDAGNADALVVVATGTAVPLYNAAGVLQTSFRLWNGTDNDYTTTATQVTVNSTGTLGTAGKGFKGPDGLTILYTADGNALLTRDDVSSVTIPAGTDGQVVSYDSGGNLVATTPATAPTWSTLSGKPTLSSYALTYLDDADAAATRATLLAAADSAVVKLSGDQTVAGVKTFSSAPIVPDGAFDTDVISNFDAAVADANDTALVVHGAVYDEGDPLPSLPSTGLWVAIARAAVAADVAFTTLGSAAGSGTDAATWTATISRAFASGTYAVAMVNLATTGTTAQLPTTMTGGGMTWTIPTDATAAPLSGLTTDGKCGMAVFIGTGTGSGTSLTINAAGTMQGASWTIVEVANGLAPVQKAKSGSTVSTTPSLSLTAVDPTHAVLGFLAQNTSTDCTIGATVPVWNELGTLNIAPSAPPSASVKTIWRLDGINSVAFSGATSASKRIFALEIPPA